MSAVRDDLAPAPAVHSHPDHTGWSDSSARAVLQLMVEAVAEMIGFEVATLSVTLDDELVTMAYTGPDEHRDYMYENADPVSVLDQVVERGERWGRFYFLDGETYQPDDLEGHWVIMVDDRADHPEAWHPLDVLAGILTDDEGRVIGVLSVDKPVTGLRPDERQRSLLERYAAQAERAVVTAFEREDMVKQIAHAESARRMIRSASRPAHGSLDEVLRDVHDPLVRGFGARGTWLHVFRHDDDGADLVRLVGGDPITLPADVIGIVERVAPRLWADQRALVVNVDDPSPGLPDEFRSLLRDRQLSSILSVGLGVGTECVGFLAVTRSLGEPAWSQVELDSALQIGHDLGAALMTARALEGERQLVRELQELDGYRSQLIATLSHELRTPLTVIAGNLELLGGVELDEKVARHHEAMTRGAARMQKVVDDLLLLARVSDPQHPLARTQVDLRHTVSDVASLVDSAAAVKGVSLGVDLDPEPLTVAGDPTEIDRLVGNLVSNAVKYTPAGGGVRISASRSGAQVVLRVADDGLGISEEDQRSLFRAFFRTTNPEALREQGTGLGLSIVASIVERHQGRVDVWSRLGEGTTFTVTLPAA
jgi:signal transduction histidine kinase